MSVLDLVGPVDVDCLRSEVLSLDGPASTNTAKQFAQCRPTGVELVRASRQLRRKAVTICALSIASYLGLLLATSPLLAVPMALALVFGAITISTSVMHDANHGAFGSKRLNRAFGFSGDVLGASSWLWRQKHNVMHHTNTNVMGLDTDIEQMPFARLAPEQPWKPWYRFQHVYIWALYGFLVVQWVFVSDFSSLRSGRIGSQPIGRRPSRRELVALYAGKAIHVSWALVLPMVFHRWWIVLLTYFVCSWLLGFALAVTFQLAHCVDSTEFANLGAQRRGADFASHQLRTTANVVCRGLVGRAIGWTVGGLHYQIEHHLAPGVPHTAYPAMAIRVEAVCKTTDIEYREHRSVRAALASHQRWLRAMGNPPPNC
jgi:linoleoyl-CoA desaturase